MYSGIERIELKQAVDRQYIVHRPAVPGGNRRLRGNVQAGPLVAGGESQDISAEIAPGKAWRRGKSR